MIVSYKCRCLKAEREVEIDGRGADEDLGPFMERMRCDVAADHSRCSPFCTASTLQYLKVPSSQAGVGRRLN